CWVVFCGDSNGAAKQVGQMSVDEANDQFNPDPALVRILQGGHDRATTDQLLRCYYQERHDRWMRRCQQGWEATGDPAFMVEAQLLIDFDQRPPPPWLSEAIHDLAMKGRAKEHATRAHNALIKRRRYEAVCDAKLAGLTWDAAYADAAKALAETPARGGVDS